MNEDASLLIANDAFGAGEKAITIMKKVPPLMLTILCCFFVCISLYLMDLIDANQRIYCEI